MAKKYRGFEVKENEWAGAWVKGDISIYAQDLKGPGTVYIVFKDGERRKREYKTLDAAINSVTKELEPDAEISAIKIARESAGLTREEIERVIGIPHSTLCSWETNHRKCPGWVERLLVAEIGRISDAKKKLGV